MNAVEGWERWWPCALALAMLGACGDDADVSSDSAPGTGSAPQQITLEAAATELRALVDSTAAEVLPGAVPGVYDENENPNGRQLCSSMSDEVREDYGLTFEVRSDEAEDVIAEVRSYWRSRGSHSTRLTSPRERTQWRRAWMGSGFVPPRSDRPTMSP